MSYLTNVVSRFDDGFAPFAEIEFVGSAVVPGLFFRGGGEIGDRSLEKSAVCRKSATSFRNGRLIDQRGGRKDGRDRLGSPGERGRYVRYRLRSSRHGGSVDSTPGFGPPEPILHKIRGVVPHLRVNLYRAAYCEKYKSAHFERESRHGTESYCRSR